MSPLKIMLVAGVLALPGLAGGAGEPVAESESWVLLRPNLVGDAAVEDGQELFELEAPFRAENPAMVPIRFAPGEAAPELRRLILVVDENPAPVVAEFVFGEAAGPVDVETRIRVDAYSNVRAIAETVDGTFYMVERFVRASGGCAAPPAGDVETARATLGQMAVAWLDDGALQTGVRREAEVMVRHPNHSGLQRDQVTHLFVPAHFVDTLEVRQGEDLVFTMTGGISLSENPFFRFHYVDNGAGALHVQATDTKGGSFSGTFALGM